MEAERTTRYAEALLAYPSPPMTVRSRTRLGQSQRRVPGSQREALLDERQAAFAAGQGVLDRTTDEAERRRIQELIAEQEAQLPEQKPGAAALSVLPTRNDLPPLPRNGSKRQYFSALSATGYIWT